MEKVELKTKNGWTTKPNGDGLYKIKCKNNDIEFAVICGKEDYARIQTLTHIWVSESIYHPYYENALYLGPLKE